MRKQTTQAKEVYWNNHGYLFKTNENMQANVFKIRFWSVADDIQCASIGEKQMVTWWRGYLVVVSQDNKQIQRPSVG